MPEKIIQILVSDPKEEWLFSDCMSKDGHSPFIIEDVWEFMRIGTDQSRADCLILDINLKGLDGLQVMHRLRRARQRPLPTIMLGPDIVSLAVRAIKSGATDYLPKPVDAETICLAVEAVISQPSGTEPEEQISLEQLSPRENQVLYALVSGQSAADAAKSLSISVHAIHFHGRNIRKKFGVSTTKQLIAKVSGLINPD